jgi:nucleotide-binding universal stress UspA family protein
VTDITVAESLSRSFWVSCYFGQLVNLAAHAGSQLLSAEEEMAGKPIIVGTDGSEESMRAVEWAAREAALHHSPLRVVSVATLPPRMSWHHPHGRPDAAADVVHQTHARVLASAAERAAELEPGLAVDTQLLFGPPARTLAETTADASMLVVGSHGAGAFSAMALASVSRYAATHGRCPVVVRRQETTSVHREIVVGVGDLDHSADALGFAFEEAALRKARLIAVHAWSCFLPAPGPGDKLTAGERAAANPSHLSPGTGARLQDILTGWQEKYPAVEIGTEIMHAHPAHMLAAASTCADLVVLGRSAGATDRSGVGSVIHAVLHHAMGPVAIVAA